MIYTEILVLGCICIFIAVLLFITFKLTKEINLQIRKCDELAAWAKNELERREDDKSRSNRVS